jgi:hypothetical protein
MNHRVSPPGTAKGRRAWLFLSILLPALASKVSTQTTSSPNPLGEGYPAGTAGGSRPYLAAIGPPSLRFEDVLPPPDLATCRPAGAPPKLPEKEKAADKDVILPKPTRAASVAAAKASPAVPAPASAAAPTPPGILPDDAPAQVRPEDFLPYFQYPGAAPRGRSAEAPPSPPLPVSTATYTQDQ